MILNKHSLKKNVSVFKLLGLCRQMVAHIYRYFSQNVLVVEKVKRQFYVNILGKNSMNNISNFKYVGEKRMFSKSVFDFFFPLLSSATLTANEIF